MNTIIEMEVYRTDAGNEPFNNWFNKLKKSTQMIIDARLERVTRGNLGDCTPLKGGIAEFRIDYGPGYRIYFGKAEQTIILLLGSDKSSQQLDIKKAKIYWLDYKEHNHEKNI